MSAQPYLPFRGLSGWFSCSINPAVAQLWDSYGGTLAGDDEASYLFSDDATAKDTIRVYETQHEVAVFQSSWIHQVILRRCSIHDVPLGQYLLLPQSLASAETGSPQLTSLIPTVSHTITSEASTIENKWRGSQESQYQHNHHQGGKNRLNPNSGSNTCVMDSSASVAAQSESGNDSNGNGVYSLSESAMVMFAEYNATWDKLESRLRSTDPKGCTLTDIADAVQVPCVANASLIDFNTSQPEFKIRRV